MKSSDYCTEEDDRYYKRLRSLLMARKDASIKERILANLNKAISEKIPRP